MRFLPSALNVKVSRFKQARVNGGSNYDSLKVAKCLVKSLLDFDFQYEYKLRKRGLPILYVCGMYS